MALDAAPRWRSMPHPDGARCRAPLALDAAPERRPNKCRNGARHCADRAPQTAPETAPATAPRWCRNQRQMASESALGRCLKQQSIRCLVPRRNDTGNDAKIALEMTPEMAPRPTPKWRPNRPRITTRARRTKRNGARRHASLQHSMVPQSYESPTLQRRSATHEAPRWRMKLR